MRKRKTYIINDIIHSEGKVSFIGETAIVSLPKSWVKEHNIKKGTRVIKVANSILTISVKG